MLEWSDVVTDSHGQRHQVWVAPGPFWARRCTSDQRYLLRDENSMETWRLRPRQASVEFKAAFLKSRLDFRKQQALRVVTLRNTRVNKELFVQYSMKYWLE